MSTIYKGPERRRMNDDSRELLIEVRNDVRHLVENFNNHVKDDEKQFSELWKSNDLLKRIAFIAIGGVSVLQIVLHFLK